MNVSTIRAVEFDALARANKVGAENMVLQVRDEIRRDNPHLLDFFNSTCDVFTQLPSPVREEVIRIFMGTFVVMYLSIKKELENEPTTS